MEQFPTSEKSEMMSEKNRKIILLNGYKFSFHKNLAAGTKRWKCIQHNCKAYFKRNQEGKTTFEQLNHNHEKTEANVIRRQEISNRLKRKAEDTFFIRPSHLIHKEIGETDDGILRMENITRIRKNINAARVKNYRLPKNVDDVHKVLSKGPGQYAVKTNQNEDSLY